jgi:hypothetical protein
MKNNRLLAYLSICALCLLLDHNAEGASITVQNASFETGTLPLNAGNGPFSQLIVGSTLYATSGACADWTTSSTTTNAAAGCFAPSAGGHNWSSQWWTGNNIGYLQLSGAGTVSLSQTLSATLQDNTTYSLSALVGRREFTPSFNYAIQLWAGGTLLDSASDLALGSDSFASDSLTYFSGTSNPTGQQLEIVLTSTYSGAFTEAFFDDVSLSAEAAAAPEPATWGFAGVGIIVLTLLKRNLKPAQRR